MQPTRTRSTTHVRIRSTMSGHWQWELVTGDGHIASESESFADRQDCEADALKQDLPLTGMSRRRNKGPVARAAAAMRGWSVSRDGMDLWTWTRSETESEPAATSTRAFLSKAECVADAEKHGYAAPATTEK